MPRLMLYPLTFRPRLVEKIWGGRRLESLGKPLPPDAQVGESWELYDFPPGVIVGETGWVSSVVANGPLAGRTLHELLEQFGHDLHGDAPLLGPHGQFPILLKFLDARETLSVQVHPSEVYAEAHPEAHVKTEAWYVVEAEPGSILYRGVKAGVTREAFREALAAGGKAVEPMLRAVSAKAGQAFFLPSGTLHALGAGLLVAEVQTPSDTTFRVYDFDRVDPKTGSPRTLHVGPALECIDFGPPQPAPPRSHVAGYFTTVTRLVSCPRFTVEKVRFSEGIEEAVPYDQPVAWMMLEGTAEVRVEGLAEPVRLTRGQTALLPAKMAAPVLRTLSDCAWLEVTFPTKATATPAAMPARG